jgi:hypothetical protein
MSDLDDAMLERMIHIVNNEHKPFSYFDFLDLMKPKTFRNKISLLKKEGVVEPDIRSSIAFHTLKGHKFGKPGTLDHTVVHNHPLYKFLENLVLDKQSIHNIRLRFTVPNIWVILSEDLGFRKNKRSKDIVVPSWRKSNAILGITVHKTDTVSVTIACSFQPLRLDFVGINCFFTLLGGLEEKLQNLLISHSKTNPLIPECAKWIITMWHCGRDELVEYTGQKFSITVENAQHILARVYSKNFGSKTRRRVEIQEYPNKTPFEAIEDKLNCNS